MTEKEQVLQYFVRTTWITFGSMLIILVPLFNINFVLFFGLPMVLIPFVLIVCSRFFCTHLKSGKRIDFTTKKYLPKHIGKYSYPISFLVFSLVLYFFFTQKIYLSYALLAVSMFAMTLFQMFWVHKLRCTS